MMFSLIFTTVASLCQLYLCWRAGSASLFGRHLPAGLLTAGGLILWLVMAAGFLYGVSHANPLARGLELAAMTWLGCLFLLSSSLLAVELITGGGWLLPGLAPPLRALALLAGLILSVLALYQGNRAPVVDRFEVTLPRLPTALDGTVVVAISDLHVGNLTGTGWLAARIEQAQRLKPDLVLLLGDIFEGHGGLLPPPLASRVLRGLRAPLGVFGVAGNHEFYGDVARTLQALKQGGVRLLRDSWVEVAPGLVLAGVEERSFSRDHAAGRGRITRTLAGCPPKACVILLSHKPRHAKEAARCRVELMLSGHTHGGQLWPFNYLVRYFFPLLAGRYQVDGMPVIVSRGAGTWGPPMRLWPPGEMLRIVLHSASASGKGP